MKTLMTSIAALVVMAMLSAAALAAQPAASPVPGPPVAYACEEPGANLGVVANWDDQFYPFDPPICNEASENFFLCLAKFGQFQIETPSVAAFAPDIVDMYLTAGASATQGKCGLYVAPPRTYWLCYGNRGEQSHGSRPGECDQDACRGCARPARLQDNQDRYQGRQLLPDLRRPGPEDDGKGGLHRKRR